MPIANSPFPPRLGALALAILSIAVLARPTDAQILVWPPEPKGSTEKEERVKVLHIDAAAEPEPALRYRFWPTAGQETSGNVMTVIQRANGMRLEQRASRRPDAFYDSETRWLEDPLDELPRDAIREYLEANKSVLTEIHRAALMKESKYEIGLENLTGPAVIQFQLNDFQNARDLARLLKLQIRLALAEQRYEDAARYLQSGFRLAESVGQASDLLIGRLVGIAISGMMLGGVQEAITQPESPNLYWALASLPPSTWEVQRAIEYESHLMERMLPSLSELPGNLSDDAWRARLIEVISEFMSIASDYMQAQAADSDKARIESQLLAGVLVIAFDGGARSHLKNVGYETDAVQRMSPSEAVLRATRERLRHVTNDFFKWSLLPATIREGYASEADELRNPEGALPDPAAVISGLLRPAVEATQSAGMRAEQSVAFLATVEALRMHAAEYGQFPESLENLQPVPAFRDPVTGEEFAYEKVSDTEARLERKQVHSGQLDTELRLELRN